MGAIEEALKLNLVLANLHWSHRTYERKMHDIVRTRYATKGVHNCFLRIEMLGAPYLIRNMTHDVCESTPGLLFRRARDIPNDFGDGNSAVHILANPESIGTPGPDKSARKVYPYRSFARTLRDMFRKERRDGCVWLRMGAFGACRAIDIGYLFPRELLCKM